MTTPRRTRWKEFWDQVLEALRIIAFLLLVATVWLVLAYVCGRQALMITEEGARELMRQVLPGIW